MPGGLRSSNRNNEKSVMDDCCKYHNENEVVIYYKDNEVVFVHPEFAHVYHHRPVWSMRHYERIGMYEQSISYDFPIKGILTRKHMGTLKTTMCQDEIIHQSFIPTKGISLRVVESKNICPHCGGTLEM